LKIIFLHWIRIGLTIPKKWTEQQPYSQDIFLLEPFVFVFKESKHIKFCICITLFKQSVYNSYIGVTGLNIITNSFAPRICRIYSRISRPALCCTINIEKISSAKKYLGVLRIKMIFVQNELKVLTLKTSVNHF
jgi:hypothetical protein